MKTDLYSEGFIVNYKEGDKSIHHKMIMHKDSLNDKSHRVILGDTLTGIAYKFYKNSSLWFYIADVNNIDNPFILETGKSIIIPNINKYEL